jgi:hypothetical protein
MIVYSRQKKDKRIVVIVNASENTKKFDLQGKYINLFDGKEYMGEIDGFNSLILLQKDE